MPLKLEIRNSEFRTQNLQRRRQNPEPETRNPEPGTFKRQSGFLLVTAIFLLVILAALGAFMLTISGTQQTSSALDVQGSRAYQAARAGIDWASYRVLIGGIPCGSGYSYERTITIDHTKVPNTDQSNFPMLFSGTYSYLVDDNNHVYNSNGFDIIFTSDLAGLNKLDHEIESYNAATGAVSFWVRVPVVSHTTDTVIYLCYGNQAITTSQENTSGVWDSNYAGVWHLKEIGNGTAGEFKDSTNNANNGQGGAITTPHSSGTPTQATGKIGYGEQFIGGVAGACPASPPCQYIQIADTASLDVTAQLTMEAWVKLPTAYNQKIVGKTDQLVTRGYLLAVQNSSGSLSLYPEIWDSAGTDNTFISGTTFSTNTWTHVAVTWTTGGNMKGYINGVQVNSISAGSNNIGNGGTTPKMRIAASPWDSPGPVPAWPLAGMVDEVRISSWARSADWIKTEYNNQNSPATFYALGAEITGGTFCNPPPTTTTQNLTGMGGTLSGFTTTVACSSTSTTEGSATRIVYQITSTASQGTAGTLSGVERQLQVTLIK